MMAGIRTDHVPREDGRDCKATRRCELCGNDVSVCVRHVDMVRFLDGEGFVQDLFPYLTADERELLMNGFCGPCFDSFCPPDEDD